MPKLTGEERVLALDVRRSSFGFAISEGPDRLLDWGVRSFRGGTNAVKIPAKTKLASLCDEYAPRVLVVRERAPRPGEKQALSALVRLVAAERGIPVRIVRRAHVKRAFAGRRNKEEIATAISVRFPELASKLPPKRKIWKSENYRMRIFDAAAAGIAYFAEKKTEQA